MRIFAWWVGKAWSQWHVLSFGRPLCGTAVPNVVRAQFDREVRPSDWPRVCQKCRDLAWAGMAGPVDRDVPTAGRERVST